MKKIQYLAVCAVALLTLTTACKKETGERADVTFEVVIAKEAAKADDGSKVYLDNGLYPNWNSDDPIRVNDGDGTVTPYEGDETRGTFTANITEPSDHDYYAVFPASAAKEITSTGTIAYDLHSEQKVFLPRVQPYETYEDNGTVKQKINAPMFAYNPEHPVLQFHNLCGVMAITITNDKAWDMVLDSIQVEATTKQLNGEISITDYTTETPYVSAPTHAVDSFDVDARQSNIVSLGGINADLRSTLLSSDDASLHGDAPTSITVYVYLPVIKQNEINGNLFYIRAFSHPKWKNASGNYTADNEVHISYEMRQTSSTYAYMNRNSIVPISISLAQCKPTFTSLKPFTKSSNNLKVCFSRGNAQYFIKTYNYQTPGNYNDGHSTGYWRFSPRQWDFLYLKNLWNQTYTGEDDLSGEDDLLGRYDQYAAIQQGTYYGKEWHKGWIEHFTYDSGLDPVRHYHTGTDWDGCNYNSDFLRSHYSNWGAHFTNVTNNSPWTSLTTDEMNYILYGRTTVNNSNKCNYAWVDLTDVTGGTSYNSTSDLYGIMILPDGFEINSTQDRNTIEALGMTYGNFKNYANENGNGTNNGDNAGRDRDDNQMTKQQFEYYEAKGCIFIPCIGAIDGMGDGNDLWTEEYTPEASVWLIGNGSTTHQASMLMATADHGTIVLLVIPLHNYADCRTASDAQCYRKFNVRLVREYSNNNGMDYKYDPFQ